MRIASDKIVHLREGEVFVFGSNEAGIHEAGAAHLAKQWGARTGQGFGMMGNTFGIPTKDQYLQVLPLDIINQYVDSFALFADNAKHLNFLVTEIGCGYARYRPEQIAPMFRLVSFMENVWLPQRFLDVLNKRENG